MRRRTGAEAQVETGKTQEEKEKRRGRGGKSQDVERVCGDVLDGCIRIVVVQPSARG